MHHGMRLGFIGNRIYRTEWFLIHLYCICVVVLCRIDIVVSTQSTLDVYDVSIFRRMRPFAVIVVAAVAILYPCRTLCVIGAVVRCVSVCIRMARISPSV